MIDISNGIKRLPILEEANDENPEKAEPTTRAGQIPTTLVVTFDRLGKKIYAGTNRGHLRIVDTQSRTVGFFFFGRYATTLRLWIQSDLRLTHTF